MKLTDAKGGETASFTYGAYGELLSGSTSFTRFLYNGRCGVTTDDNGLYYMRQRYYSPELKRFVNQDVVKGSLDNSQSLNRYSYVQGNPVSYTDPFGLSPQNGLFTGASFWHGVLGLLGCIPGPIGALANFVDCFIYLAQGDYFGAALCFMNGVTMGATTVASTLLKAGKLCSVANTALRVAMVSERIAGGLTFAQNFYNIGQTGIQMYCKYGIMGESLGLDTAGEVLGIGLSAMGCIGGLSSMGSTSKELLALQEKVDAGMLCFVAGTLIKTKGGSKAIEEIEVGDLVYARNTETGEEGYKEVVRLFPNSTQELIHVAVGDTVIDTTPAHRFWVEGKDFLPARDLQVGDRVLTASGELKEITFIERESLEEPVPVYNFEVKDWHTYYVSGEEILVHNMYETPGGANGNKANSQGGSVPKSNKLALGLWDYLEEFATKNNAHTYKSFSDTTNWQEGVRDALFNPDMQIVVNLDGIDNPLLAAQRAASNKGGATDWELLQIKLTPSAWDRITWYKNGEIVLNPFG